MPPETRGAVAAAIAAVAAVEASAASAAAATSSTAPTDPPGPSSAPPPPPTSRRTSLLRRRKPSNPSPPPATTRRRGRPRRADSSPSPSPPPPAPPAPPPAKPVRQQQPPAAPSPRMADIPPPPPPLPAAGPDSPPPPDPSIPPSREATPPPSRPRSPSPAVILLESPLLHCSDPPESPAALSPQARLPSPATPAPQPSRAPSQTPPPTPPPATTHRPPPVPIQLSQLPARSPPVPPSSADPPPPSFPRHQPALVRRTGSPPRPAATTATTVPQPSHTASAPVRGPSSGPAPNLSSLRALTVWRDRERSQHEPSPPASSHATPAARTSPPPDSSLAKPTQRTSPPPLPAPKLSRPENEPTLDAKPRPSLSPPIPSPPPPEPALDAKPRPPLSPPASSPPPPPPPTAAPRPLQRLPIDAVVACSMPGGDPQARYRCRIVELRQGADGHPQAYYVHFVGADRRLDSWIDAPYVENRDDAPLVPGCSEDALAMGEAGMGEKAAKPTSPGKGTSGEGKKPDSKVAGKITRHRRRLIQEMNPVSEREAGNEFVQKMEKAREERTKVKNIARIEFGLYDMDCWYYSPYPADYSGLERLYMCAYCLKYMRLQTTYSWHCSTCKWRHPPGREIYADYRRSVHPQDAPTIKVYEVDGMLNPLYAQNLCLLAKLFLDHKTLHYDVAPFLFYVLTEESPDRPGFFDVVGFFSKEKDICGSEFNVACILTLPPYQKRGYGKFLISFSYELTRRENKTATPERPLSDLGQVSYRSFWTRYILLTLRRVKQTVSTANDIALLTGIREADVVATLKGLGMLTTWKGEHLISANMKNIDEALKKTSPWKIEVYSDLVRWDPPGSKRQVYSSGPSKRGSARASPPSTPAMVSTGRRPQQSPRSSPPPSACRKRPLQLVDPPTVSENPDFDEARSSASRFTDDQIRIMQRFVAEQGAHRIRAIMNSPFGVPRQEYESLAGRLGMDFHRVQSKLKRMVNPNKSKRAKVQESVPAPSPPARPEEDATTNEAMSPGENESDEEERRMGQARQEPSLENDVQGIMGICRQGDVTNVEKALRDIIGVVEPSKDVSVIAHLLVKRVQAPDQFTDEDNRQVKRLLDDAKIGLDQARRDSKSVARSVSPSRSKAPPLLIQEAPKPSHLGLQVPINQLHVSPGPRPAPMQRSSPEC